MITVGSCFSGIGGLDRGLESLGFEVLWQCDSDPCARAVLAAHWPGVRCYEDVGDIDARATRVSLVCGGFPCAPHSVAGKRKGTSDERWIWPEFARVIGALRPELVFIENVPGLRTSGLREVLADLAALGFDAEWGCFSAAEVGAPHIRKRIFILAHANGEGELQQGGALEEVRRWARNGGGEAVAHPHGDPGESRGACDPSEGPGGRDADRGGERPDEVAHPHGAGLEVRSQQPSRQERPAPQRGGPQGHSWAAEPDVGRVAHGVRARVDRLRLLGNACVPAQAAHAFRSLAARAL